MSSGHPYPDDVSGADIERAHGGPDLHELFDEVQARWCVMCAGEYVPATKLVCTICEAFEMAGTPLLVYACRRCDAWVEYAETGPHLEQHERNDAQVCNEGE